MAKNQSSAITALIGSCLSKLNGNTLGDLRNDWVRYPTRSYMGVCVDDLIAAGWDRWQAKETFDSLVAAGLVVKGEFGLELTKDWDELAKYSVDRSPSLKDHYHDVWQARWDNDTQDLY